MATRLGTYLGTNLGTVEGTGDDASAGLTLAELEDYLAKNLFSWMRADSRTEGATVVSFVDKVLLPASGGLAGNARSVDSAHAFAAAATQIPLIATSALMNGKEVATFSAAAPARYLSSIASSNWKCHDGSGWEIFTAWVPTTFANFRLIAATRSGAGSAGVNIGTNPSAQLVGTVQGAAGFVVACAGGTAVANVATSLDFQYREADSPRATLRQGVASVDTNALTTPAPSAGNPDGTMTIGGAFGGSLPLDGLLADLMFANRIDATLRANVQRYRLLRYGIA